MDYENKYLKYKKKYLESKNGNGSGNSNGNQRGGANGNGYGNNNWNSNGNQRGGAGEFVIQDEIHFWGRQMMEHCYFLYLGFEEEVLKKGAFVLYNKWADFLDKEIYNKGVKVTKETIVLTDSDVEKIGNINMKALGHLISTTGEYNMRVIEILDGGTWIGWIYPSLAKHMQSETLYFKQKVNGPKMSAAEEIKFINQHHGEESGATAGLIDPNPAQQPIIDLVRAYALKAMSKYNEGKFLSDTRAPMPFPTEWTKQDEEILKGMHSDEQASLLALSIRYSEELTQLAKNTGDKIEANQLKSVISPILAHHVHREFARFTMTLQQLKGTA